MHPTGTFQAISNTIFGLPTTPAVGYSWRNTSSNVLQTFYSIEVDDDCCQSLNRLQPVQGEQGQIQQVDDAVAVDVAF